MKNDYVNLLHYHDNPDTQTHLRIVAGIVDGSIRYMRDPNTFDLLVHIEDVAKVNKEYKQRNYKRTLKSQEADAENHKLSCNNEIAKRYLQCCEPNCIYLVTTNQGYVICSISKLLRFLNSLPLANCTVSEELVPHNGIIKILTKKRY